MMTFVWQYIAFCLSTISFVVANQDSLLAMQLKNLQQQSSVPEIILGSTNAPVEIIMYFSPTCTHCAHYDKDVLPLIIQEYVDTAKIRLILRPLAVHSGMDILAVQLAWNYNRQGGAYNAQRYMQTMKVIMAGQKDWIIPFDEKTKAIYEEKLDGKVRSVAASINMDPNVLRVELNILDADPEGFLKLFAIEVLQMTPQEVKAAMKDDEVERHILGLTLGALKNDGKPLDFTPAFYINSKLQDEVLTMENIKKIIHESISTGKQTT